VSPKRRSILGDWSHSLASASQEYFGTMFDFAPCGQNDCWHPQQGLQLVVGVLTPTVVKLLGPLFAPMAPGLPTSDWQGCVAAGAGSRRRLAPLMSILQPIIHHRWLRSVWNLPLKSSNGHLCRARHPGSAAVPANPVCPFRASTQPFVSAFWNLAVRVPGQPHFSFQHHARIEASPPKTVSQSSICATELPIVDSR
jgi:hypothetical protein